MIPKKIHYCWLGGEPYPELIRRCFESWEEKLEGYEFVLWDKDKLVSEFHSGTDFTNLDELHEGGVWLRQAIETKKYAFAADFIRIYALNKYGGIYLDADVELSDSFDRFLSNSFFIGFDFQNDLEAAVIGSEPGHPWLNKLLAYYKERPFIKPDGKYDTRPLPTIFDQTGEDFLGYKKNGRYQEIPEHGIAIYPFEYFSPKNIYFNRINSTANTTAVHHFDGNWLKKGLKFRLKNKVHQILYVCGGKTLHDKTVRIGRKFR